MKELHDLTITQLRDAFAVMREEDMQLIVDALRALAGDTQSLARLQRLHASIEQPLMRLLDDNNFIFIDSTAQLDGNGTKAQPYSQFPNQTRCFRPVDGFFTDINYIRWADGRTHTSMVKKDGAELIDWHDLYTLDYCLERVADGRWVELTNEET